MSELRGGQEPEPNGESQPEDEIEDLPVDGEPEPEPEDEPLEPEDEQQPEPGQQRQPSRAQRRIQALDERLRAAEAERDQLRQRFMQQPMPQPAPVDPAAQAAAAQAEAERVALLPLDQQVQYWVRKQMEPLQQLTVRQQIDMHDRLDRTNFEGLQTRYPAAKRLAPQVEQALVQYRAQGMNPPREAIFKFLVGQEVLEKQEQALQKQRRTGQRQLAAQTTQPGAIRSGVARPGRQDDNSIEAIERRLGDIVF